MIFRSVCAHIACMTIVCACQKNSGKRVKEIRGQKECEKACHPLCKAHKRKATTTKNSSKPLYFSNGCEEKKIQNDSRWRRLMRHQRLEPNFVCKQITPKICTTNDGAKKSSTEHMTKYKNRIVTFRSQEIHRSLSNTIFLVEVFRLHTDFVALAFGYSHCVFYSIGNGSFFSVARHSDILVYMCQWERVWRR